MASRRRFGPVCDEMSLSTAKWACLYQHELVCREVALFVATSTYPRRFHLIQAKTNLSTEKSGCLAQSGLVWPKMSSCCDKWVFREIRRVIILWPARPH